jgi:hypothetical protein
VSIRHSALGRGVAILSAIVASSASAGAQYPPPAGDLPPSIPSAPPATGVPTAPFGPGAIVQVTSGGDPVTVFVARIPTGAAGPPPDTDFVKIGKTPIEFQLPPGSYQIEVQGHGVSHESMLFEMHAEPRRLLVKTGSEGLGIAGTLCLGVGITAVLAATAILISGSKSPQKLDKPAIVIPMYAAGGVLTGMGIGFQLAADTDIEQQKPRRSAPELSAGLAAIWHF